MKKIAILQSNYIPWKGYFDLIAAVDEFIIFDDMQYTKRDWRNRNKIKTPQGLKWLTIPVQVKGKYHQKIMETKIDGTSWARHHWKYIENCYQSADHFNDIADWLAPIYLQESHCYISKLNQRLIRAICEYVGIKTTITNSWDYNLLEGKTLRLADLCMQAGGTQYISGMAAKSYIDEQVFTKMGIQLRWFDYSGYPEYSQLWGEFQHEVSILDLLFNCGKGAHRYMRYVTP